jgi:hypothetical protein
VKPELCERKARRPEVSIAAKERVGQGVRGLRSAFHGQRGGSRPEVRTGQAGRIEKRRDEVGKPHLLGGGQERHSQVKKKKRLEGWGRLQAGDIRAVPAMMLPRLARRKYCAWRGKQQSNKKEKWATKIPRSRL